MNVFKVRFEALRLYFSRIMMQCGINKGFLSYLIVCSVQVDDSGSGHTTSESKQWILSPEGERPDGGRYPL